MRGRTTIQLTFEMEFSHDGNGARVLAIRSDGHTLSVADEAVLISTLPPELWEQIKADAFEDAEPVEEE